MLTTEQDWSELAEGARNLLEDSKVIRYSREELIEARIIADIDAERTAMLKVVEAARDLSDDSLRDTAGSYYPHADHYRCTVDRMEALRAALEAVS